MKKYFILLLCSLSFLQLIAQYPVPYLKKDRNYIYVDSATMKPVIEKGYPYAYPFTGGCAFVGLSGFPSPKFAIIDKTGKEITGFLFNNPSEFREGFAPVSYTSSAKYFFIDGTGKEFAREYSQVYIFSEGLARVTSSKGKCGFVDNRIKEVIVPQYDDAGLFKEGLAWVKLNNKYGFIDKTGKVIVQIKYDGAEDFSNGVAVVTLNKKKGYVDLTGKEIASPQYDFAYKGVTDLLQVGNNDTGSYNYKFGFIDRTGKTVIPLKYRTVSDFKNGNALVTEGGNGLEKEGRKVSLINKKGQKLAALDRFDGYSDFSEGFSFGVIRKGLPDAGKLILINSKGKEVSPVKFDALKKFADGIAMVWSGKKIGFIDTTGKLVVPYLYDECFDGFDKGFARVKQGYNWFYIDKAGREYREK